MKKIKNKIIMKIILLVTSLIGFIISVIFNNSFSIGFCSSFIGASIIWLIRLVKMSNNKEKAREYEILEKDERLKLLNMQARSITISIVEFVLIVIGFIGYIINNETLLFTTTSIAFGSVFIYLIVYFILGKIK